LVHLKESALDLRTLGKSIRRLGLQLFEYKLCTRIVYHVVDVIYWLRPVQR
jgi:hypothetical protein